MKFFVVTLALIALANGLPQQQPQLRQRQRDGRQSSINYGAPDASAPAIYGGPAGGALDVSESINDELTNYNNQDNVAQASELDQQSAGAPKAGAAAAGRGASSAAGNRNNEDNGGDPIAMLRDSVPGTPGEDYPIYAEAPETKFTCDAKVNGGYYADAEAECQAFHICTADSEGGLAKYSFLCPNGTIFNQEYFICDWWFNVDCSKAEALANSRNAELEAARQEADANAASENKISGAASSRSETVVAPRNNAQAPLSNYGAGTGFEQELAESSNAQPILSNYGAQ